MSDLFQLLNNAPSLKTDDALQAIAAALLDIVQTDAETQNRVKAAETLLQVKDIISAKQVLTALDDTNSKVRLHTVKVLRGMIDQNVINRLVQCLDDVDPMVRAEVLETLVENEVSSVTRTESHCHAQ